MTSKDDDTGHSNETNSATKETIDLGSLGWQALFDLNTSAAVLDRLVREESEEVRLIVCSNPSLSEETLRWIVENGSDEERSEIASRSDIPADVAWQLAGSSRYELRSKVASNASAPVDLLDALLDDKNRDVRISAAGNSSVRPEKLIELVDIAVESFLRAGALRNPSLPAQQMSVIVHEGDWRDKTDVAQNPALPVFMLRLLLMDLDTTVVRYAVLVMLKRGVRRGDNDED